jgi:predicted O-linked N-acetylglucosamine transferase (SPINDLY family)
MKRNHWNSADETHLLRLITQGAYGQLESVARRILSKTRDHPLALKALAVACISGGRVQEAKPLLQRAAKLYPRDPELHSNLAIILTTEDDHESALACIDRALKLEPQRADFHANRALALLNLGAIHGSMMSARTALQFDPSHPKAANTLGAALHRQCKFDAALEAFQRATTNDPGSLDSFLNFVVTLGDVGRHSAAANCARQVLEEGEPTQTEIDMIFPYLCAAERADCDWRRADAASMLRQTMLRQVDQGPEPFFITHMEDIDRTTLRRGAEVYGRAYLRGTGVALGEPRGSAVPAGESPDRPLRIGFISADFRDHPVSELAVGLYECLDRSAFSIYAYGYGPSEPSQLRHRLLDAFDIFRDIDALSFVEAATLIRQDAIDILVDMAGWTKFSRPGILTYAPAPVIASWLGFPGTLGVPGLAHYLISDPIVTPMEHAGDYAENLALLPHSYQPSSRTGDGRVTPTRGQCGLPEDAFVFCSFNQSVKLTPHIFDLWCQLLLRNPGSVLWLGFQSELAQANLRAIARAREVPETSIVFAPWCALPEHLARLPLADLALDTFPYGSHTTGSDMLWAGVPLIARMGETFASRVSSSLLTAVGLQELITYTDDDYLTLADGLANDRSRYSAYRRHLVNARLSAPLFDTRRFAHDMGRLLRAMWQNHVRGQHQAIRIP